jgi:hypothetical protein
VTAIAFKAGVIAADSGAWHGDVLISTTEEKIVRLESGCFLAASGPADIIFNVVAWLNGVGPKPEPATEDDRYSAILVDPKTGMAEFLSPKSHSPVGKFGSVVALGSHADFLYGAMAAGASAEEAIRLAIRYCPYAAGEVQVRKVGLAMPE